MLTGIVACLAVGGYAYYRLNGKKAETKRFTDFIEKATFQNIPFIKKEELGYTVSYYQEDKFSMEMWEKDGHFRLFVRDDELNKPVFIIEKNDKGLNVQHPTIFYYRSAFEQKRGLFKAFIHRYVRGEFDVVSSEEMDAKHSIEKDELGKLPPAIQEKILLLQSKYERILVKKEELDIESYVLLETLIFQDLKQIIQTYQSLSEESQNAYQEDVMQGLDDIVAHLQRIEDRFTNDQVRELQKSLRIIKKRGDL